MALLDALDIGEADVVGLDLGAPWWFGFHAVPGPAEQVLAGNEVVIAESGHTIPQDRPDELVALLPPFLA